MNISHLPQLKNKPKKYQPLMCVGRTSLLISSFLTIVSGSLGVSCGSSGGGAAGGPGFLTSNLSCLVNPSMLDSKFLASVFRSTNKTILSQTLDQNRNSLHLPFA